MHVILCHTLGPYHAARYSALSKLRDDFIIIELSSEQTSHSWKSDKQNFPFKKVLLHAGPRQELSPNTYTRMLLATLNLLQPISVISLSYSEPFMRAATLWARKHNAISIMINASWEGDKRRNVLLESIKSIWCRWAYDAAFVTGIRAAQYSHKLGIPEQKIWKRCGVVDNSYFSKGATKAREDELLLRKTLNLPEKYFLVISRFSPEKNISRLLEAFKLYLDGQGDWDLVLIGEGQQEQLIKNLAAEISREKIHILGWKAYSELPGYYGLAQGLILPSVSETWGLVVNEAMASELPVLVSTKCGCLPELCIPGVNGFQFDPYHTNNIATAFFKLSSLRREQLVEMGEKSKSIIQNFSPEIMAKSLSDCLDSFL